MEKIINPLLTVYLTPTGTISYPSPLLSSCLIPVCNWCHGGWQATLLLQILCTLRHQQVSQWPEAFVLDNGLKYYNFVNTVGGKKKASDSERSHRSLKKFVDAFLFFIKNYLKYNLIISNIKGTNLWID